MYFTCALFPLGELNVTSSLVGSELCGAPSGQDIHTAFRAGPDSRSPTLRRVVL